MKKLIFRQIEAAKKKTEKAYMVARRIALGIGRMEHVRNG